MSETYVYEKNLGSTKVRVIKGDVTLQEVDAFVYYATSDLKLGMGFGGAISVRGGPSIQEELNKLGPLETTQCAVTAAGELKAKHIIHAVGPRFQEPDTERKLTETMRNVLRLAEEKEMQTIALPPMGCGFYGVPLDLSARVTFETIKAHTAGQTHLKEVIVCAVDNRDYKPFAEKLAAIS